MAHVITLDQIKEHLEASYYLAYVDRNSDLDDNADEIQAHIHGDYNAVVGIEDNWQADRYDAVMEAINKAWAELADDLGVDVDELSGQADEFEDQLRDIIHDRDKSDVMKDLIRNTSDPVMFFDTGLEVGDYTTDMEECVAEIKQTLSIDASDERFDKLIAEMCGNASYGGQLVVYFNGDLSYWLGYRETWPNTIRFSGKVSIAIVNHGNGSGGECEIEHTFDLPFNNMNVFLDKTIKYNYTYAVCGMSRDWCSGTEVQMMDGVDAHPAEPSSINDHLDQEARYKATFAAGSCTPGDMDINRHRNREYINNYPCGNKCKDCGTFWID